MDPDRLPQDMATESPALTYVDLFCGAGGLSLGLMSAGLKPVRAYDHFDAAVATYRRNIGAHVEDTEIHDAMVLPRATIIAGGPPCQGFSSAGQRRIGDKRNTLVSVFASLVAQHRPAMFLFENVEGFLTAENGAYVLDLLEPLVAAGYRIHLRKVNAANYGVPQHRKRVLGIGALGFDPAFPAPTHRASGAPGAQRAGRRDLPSTPTVLDALAGLGPPSLSAPGIPTGHFAMPLDDEDLARVSSLREGQTMRDLPEHLWHESYRRRAFRRVKDGMPTERRGGAPCGIRRLVGNQPSKAITSGARAEFIHPREDRYLTMRECARIQGFPDEFEFVGRQADQHILVGNAVPIVLAHIVGETLARDLRASRRVRKPGALLSFVPTLAEGMSPALARTAAQVQRTFGADAPEGRAVEDEQMRLSWG